MSEANTQPVATSADPAVSSAAEAPSAQINPTSDLDALLSDFDIQTKPQPATSTVAKPEESEVVQLRKTVEAFVSRETAKQNKADLTDAIKEVRGSHSIPDYAVRGWLSEMAETDPRINSIWEQREQNPAAAKKLIAGLRSKFDAAQAGSKGPDADATSDKLAVAAAVRGTSQKAPEPSQPNYGKMTAAEFEAEKAKLGL